MIRLTIIFYLGLYDNNLLYFVQLCQVLKTVACKNSSNILPCSTEFSAPRRIAVLLRRLQWALYTCQHLAPSGSSLIFCSPAAAAEAGARETG